MRNVKLIAKNTVSQVLSITIGLFFSIAGAHLLSIAEFGELRYAMTLLPIFMTFSLPGYDSIILRNAHLRKHVPLLEIFYVKAGCALLGTVVILGAVFVLRDHINNTLMFFLVCIALLLPLFDTGTGYRNYLLGNRLRHAGIHLVVVTRMISFALMVASFFLIYTYDLKRIYILPAYLLALIVPTLTIFFLVAHRQKSWKMQKISQLDIPAAVAATFAGMIYMLAFSLDKLLVRQELSATQLASYAILVMGPQELSKLVDATVPLFYRQLFFSKQKIVLREKLKTLLLLPCLILIYVALFYTFSGFVFGAAYHYSLGSVALSGLMIASLSFEFFNIHHILATFGSRLYFIYSLSNLLTSAVILTAALSAGGINGLMMGLIFKQIAIPIIFSYIHRRKMHEI